MIEDFFLTSLKLKNIQRKGWINKLQLKYPESVADHSYSMTLMAMVLSDLLKLDTEKIVKMALLHDLAESLVGDFTPEEISKQKKNQLENNAIKKIFANLPSDLAKEYGKIWNEYQTNQTKESLFVHEIDKLEMIFQAKNYLEKGASKKNLQPFIESANSEIQNKQLREIMSKLF